MATPTHPDRLHQAFADAFAARDLDALLDLYEPGAVQLGPDGRTLQGHQQIRDALEHLLQAGISLQGRQVTALISGDLALTSTRYDRPAAAGASPTAGVSTAEVLRRQADGTWRVVIDVPGFA